MGNADANEQYFAEERARLVAAIRKSISDMRGTSLRKVDALAKIDKAAADFERETYGNNEC
jgi:hypothetical protein